jgi:lipocalin
VDIPRYGGDCYEFASFPQDFQKGCTANYTLRDDAEVDVVNRCLRDSLQGGESAAEGRAQVVDTATSPNSKTVSSGPAGATTGSSNWAISMTVRWSGTPPVIPVDPEPHVVEG